MEYGLGSCIYFLEGATFPCAQIERLYVFELPPFKMHKTILLVGTLDTKGLEYAYVRKLIQERGHRTIVLDAGIFGDAPFQSKITSEQVAEAGGSSLHHLREKADRGYAMERMTRGACTLAVQLFSEGKIDGVLALGGSGGTSVATAVMRSLPIGLPKVMVSTVASGNVSSYVDVNDITMMFSVVDIAGLNRISRQILANAAGAVCGMIEQAVPKAEDKPLIAATMFGVTTPCVERVRSRMEDAGYEVLVFHATGSGGRAMEALIEGGFFSAVADITTTEWCDELVGGVLSAGPNRLEAAAHTGIPQVVSCGALDMVNFGPAQSVPIRFEDRTLYRHNANVTLMRTTPVECAQLGRIIAQKLNQSSGLTRLLVPLRGVSAIDKRGEPFYSPEANTALFESLRGHVNDSVVLEELDLHINDQAFADALADRLLECITS